MDPGASPLLTDLYQLNMIEAYLARSETKTAVFELFVRRLPARRGFLMAAGLEQALEFLEDLRFSADEIGWLKDTGRLSARTLGYLSDLRFTGDVHAMPEGTIFVADEPILRVTAPLPEAQLIEGRLINILHFQSLIASKAARLVLAAPGKRLIDFGLRRAHGAEAGLLAARASYIAGFTGTATVLAAKRFDIPVFGTMAHSYIQAHDSETDAFERFAHARPDGLVFLIDTYDTEAAARKVVALAPRLKAAGISVSGVRLDSGDLIALSKSVRRILDEGGLADVTIFASGGLDEDRLMALEKANAPIDGYGVGTSLTTSSDAPALDCAYKLQEYAGLPRRKHAQDKATLPGRKQVWRRYGPDGRMAGDTLSLANDHQEGEALIHLVMQAGKRISPSQTLDEIRKHAARELQSLPAPLRALEPGATYKVQVGKALVDATAEFDRRLTEQERKPWMSEKIAVRQSDVLVVVDIQNDFCPGGSLSVPRGHEVVPTINRLAQRFDHVVLTQDWHPPDHLSFASQHPGRKPHDTILVDYGPQILWPDHCVRATRGAEFHEDLHVPHAGLVLRKGIHRAIDSYSTFYENDRKTPTGLVGYLRDRGFTRVFLAGLAFDFCVRYSAEDAHREGFAVVVVEDACRGIDVDGSMAATRESLERLGIVRATAEAMG